MWDRHRRIRHDSRKRALKAAHARAARRGGDTKDAASEVSAQPEAAQEREAVSQSSLAEDKPGASDADTPESPPATEPESPPHDPAGSLAWTGLIFLSLVLGGFMVAVLFMLG